VLSPDGASLALSNNCVMITSSTLVAWYFLMLRRFSISIMAIGRPFPLTQG
jgi:hypothetical protein